ncbi:ABC transporter substrate-binding protein [Brevibacillus sp. 179-C9.3 HS]|uniref:ABC transporter substrate-binding protein n=1 Tax=unclassified Brevibacillus TaxID=2684853 RepID=UPI00399EFA12
MFKKGKLSLLVTMIMSLLLAACGTETAAPAPAQQAQTEQPQAEQVRKITHAMGETEIKGTPQRIVVLTNQGTESLLALGIKPVGAVKSWIGDPWFDHIKDQMSGVEVVGDETQPNMELIASLKPDLILGTKVRQEKIYTQLSAIAPTVFTENLGDSMIENFELYAKALNKETEGLKILADFDKLIADTKTKLGDKTKMEISLARFQPGKVRVYYKQNFAGVILDELGFARPAEQNKAEFSKDIAKEQINVLDGDIFFYFTSDRNGDTGASKTAQEWLSDPLAKNMKVVQTGRAYQVNEAIWNTAGGILAADLMVKDIEKIFADIN